MKAQVYWSVEDRCYIAEHPGVGLACHGDTPGEALAELGKAHALWQEVFEGKDVDTEQVCSDDDAPPDTVPFYAYGALVVLSLSVLASWCDYMAG